MMSPFGRGSGPNERLEAKEGECAELFLPFLMKLSAEEIVELQHTLTRSRREELSSELQPLSDCLLGLPGALELLADSNDEEQEQKVRDVCLLYLDSQEFSDQLFGMSLLPTLDLLDEKAALDYWTEVIARRLTRSSPEATQAEAEAFALFDAALRAFDEVYVDDELRELAERVKPGILAEIAEARARRVNLVIHDDGTD
jgi:hypothetical protein